MKYKSEFVTSVASGQRAYAANAAGVFDIPDEGITPFLDMINAGVLVPVVDPPAPAADVATLTAAVEAAVKAMDAAQARVDKAKTAAAKETAQAALDEATAAHGVAVEALAAATA